MKIKKINLNPLPQAFHKNQLQSRNLQIARQIKIFENTFDTQQNKVVYVRLTCSQKNGNTWVKYT